MKKNAILFLCIVLLASCGIGDVNKEEKINRNEIVGYLIDNILHKQLVFYAFPAPPPYPDVSLDSLYAIIEKDRSIPKDTVRAIRKTIIEHGKLLVAVDASFFVLKENYLEQLTCKKKDDFKDSFEIGNVKGIDFNKIQKSKFYEIIPLVEGKIPFSDNQRLNYHIHLGFSEIAYNKKNTSAIVIVNIVLTRMHSFTSVYHLKKKDGLWKIACKE